MISGVTFGSVNSSAKAYGGSFTAALLPRENKAENKAEKSPEVDVNKTGTTTALDAQAALGKSQVKVNNDSKPAVDFSKEEIDYMNTLDPARYGFHGDGNGFWVHTKSIMGDGIVPGNMTRQEFIADLVKDDVKAFEFAGETDKGKMFATYLYNDSTKTVTVVSGENDTIDKKSIQVKDIPEFHNMVKENVKKLKVVYGATVLRDISK